VLPFGTIIGACYHSERSLVRATIRNDHWCVLRFSTNAGACMRAFAVAVVPPAVSTRLQITTIWLSAISTRTKHEVLFSGDNVSTQASTAVIDRLRAFTGHSPERRKFSSSRPGLGTKRKPLYLESSRYKPSRGAVSLTRCFPTCDLTVLSEGAWYDDSDLA
jgi:hypothetical protein